MLTHRQRQLIVQAGTRHGRRKSGVFLCEGLRCCGEGLTHAAAQVELAACSDGFAASAAGRELVARLTGAGKVCETVPDAEFAKLAATENPQGILVVCRYPPEPPPLEKAPADPFVLLLDRVTEPGNVGTILRTAWAVGLHEVWFTDGSCDPFSPKAIRAGMGAQFALTQRSFASLAAGRAELRRHGWGGLWCSVPRGGVSCFSDAFQLRQSAVVIGNEASGIADLADAALVSIPMPGAAESLNAAQAATILLFEGVRRGLFAAT